MTTLTTTNLQQLGRSAAAFLMRFACYPVDVTPVIDGRFYPDRTLTNPDHH